MVTGVSPDVWVNWGDRAIATAYEVLEDIHKRRSPREPRGFGEDEPLMSG